MYFWYKFLTYLCYPFAPIYLYFRKLRNKEDPNRPHPINNMRAKWHSLQSTNIILNPRAKGLSNNQHRKNLKLPQTIVTRHCKKRLFRDTLVTRNT